MNTSGHGNDALMILVPVAGVVVSVILFGGPTNALEAVNTLVADLAYEVMAAVSRML